jgi:AraC-like DNA-binding protein
VSVALARIAMNLAHGHAMYTALRYLNEDLIEGRRRFRVIFAAAVAVTGLVISYFETIGLRGEPPPGLLLFQAASILVMTLGFGVWLLGMRGEVLDGRVGEIEKERVEAPAPQTGESLRAADRPAYGRLIALMADGAWREEGLTVATLAAKVGVPEHQLRALINGQLGHRNFSAFLNSHRLEEAKRLLSDPPEARKQILQIALDVGYGSIAPFNRAFKEATGKTPTEFRKDALGNG